MARILNKVVSCTIPKKQYMSKSSGLAGSFLFWHAWFLASFLLIFAIAPTEVRSTDVVSETNEQFFQLAETPGPLGEADERMRVINLSDLRLFPVGMYTNVMAAGAGQKNFLILDNLPGEDEKEKETLPDEFPPSVRWRAVKLNPMVTNRDRIKTGDELVLNLFPDVEYTACIERVDENIQGVVTVRGRVKDYPAGYIIITTAGRDTLAEIRIPQKQETYRIQSHPERKFSYLLELDAEETEIKEGAPPLLPPDA